MERLGELVPSERLLAFLVSAGAQKPPVGGA
jgi:hypothetical protein